MIVSLYFGWELTLVLAAFVPPLLFLSWLELNYEDNSVMEKKAYSKAANVSSEALQNVKTVASLNAEHYFANKYDANLREAQKAGVKQGIRSGLVSGGMFFFMYLMYAVGFWYSAELIAESTDQAILKYPIPSNILSGTPTNVTQAYLDIISNECGGYEGTVLEVCACGLPWIAFDLPSLNCGCGYGVDPNIPFLASGTCFTGGKALLIFFAIYYGALGVSNTNPTSQQPKTHPFAKLR
jgi:hypothetical protein